MSTQGPGWEEMLCLLNPVMPPEPSGPDLLVVGVEGQDATGILLRRSTGVRKLLFRHRLFTYSGSKDPGLDEARNDLLPISMAVALSVPSGVLTTLNVLETRAQNPRPEGSYLFDTLTLCLELRTLDLRWGTSRAVRLEVPATDDLYLGIAPKRRAGLVAEGQHRSLAYFESKWTRSRTVQNLPPDFRQAIGHVGSRPSVRLMRASLGKSVRLGEPIERSPTWIDARFPTLEGMHLQTTSDRDGRASVCYNESRIAYCSGNASILAAQPREPLEYIYPYRFPWVVGRVRRPDATTAYDRERKGFGGYAPGDILEQFRGLEQLTGDPFLRSEIYLYNVKTGARASIGSGMYALPYL